MMKYLFLTFSAALLLVACTKTPEEPQKNRGNILRTGKWKVSGGTIKQKLPNGKYTDNKYLDFVPACHKDDYIVFDSGVKAAVFSGTEKCNPGDAASISFLWNLSNKENMISMYDGFNIIYMDSSYIAPYRFDTLPDGTFRQATLSDGSKVNDTIWDLKWVPLATPAINVYNGTLSNFSETSFTLNYSVISTYPDTTSNHKGDPYPPPIIRPDTFKFSINFTNF